MTTAAPSVDVQLDGNRRFLVAAIAWLRDTLERDGAAAATASPSPAWSELERVRASLAAPPILDDVAAAFGLTSFESSVLLLCAAAELDGAMPAAFATASNDARRAYPTFGLALATLPEPHWNALAPTAPLRRHRLVEVDAFGDSAVLARLRIDERILHHLTGTGDIDARLEAMVTLADGEPVTLPASQRAQAERLSALWARAAGDLPLVQLCGDDAVGKRNIAAAAAASSGLRLYIARAADLPSLAQDREQLARLWQREQRLAAAALLIELDDADAPEVKRIVAALAERVGWTAARRRARPVAPRPSSRRQAGDHASAAGRAGVAVEGDARPRR